MEIIFNLEFLENFDISTPWSGLWEMFIHGGWVIFLVVIIWGIYEIWLTKKQVEYIESVEYIILAIDVPKENEQGPKAVEQIFSQIAGSESAPSFVEKYFQGILPSPFSLEIISLEGYIQFLIRTPKNMRDLIESSIYAQYPDAEISEVEDYIENIPSQFPSEEYDLWGAELVLYNKEVYPIRTYLYFENPVEEEKFKDPMAALLEALGKIGKGEQIFLQFLIVPCDASWKKKGDIEVKKLIGAKVETKLNLIDKGLKVPLNFLEWVHEQLWPVESFSKDDPVSRMQFLSPGEKKVVEAMQDKISKIGFKTKCRLIYWARKEVFSKPRGVVGVIGAIKQFNTLDMNGFRPDKKTKTAVDLGHPFRQRRIIKRQIKLVHNFKKRSFYRGANNYVLNTEELATIYHFPMRTIRAPLLKKIELKKAEPPVSLPMENIEEEFLKEDKNQWIKIEIEENKEDTSSQNESLKKGEPPKNLPQA